MVHYVYYCKPKDLHLELSCSWFSMHDSIGCQRTVQGKSPGGDSNIKMPGCVCSVSENAPILNDSISCKNIPILNRFSAQFIPNFDGNIKIQVLTYTYDLLLLISYPFCLYSHCCSSALAFSYNMYTSQKSYAYGMGQQISPILNEIFSFISFT